MRYIKTILFFTSIFLAASCLDPFYPSGGSQATAFLVVDGYLNSADGTGTLKLSQTKPLNSTAPALLVSNAQVTLEDENGNEHSFFEVEEGVYYVFGVSVDPSKKYTLKIITDANKEYRSDEITPTLTPAIDSISWKQLDDKVEVYTNTHDDANNTHYYRWKYNETWQYTSAYRSSVKIQGNQIVFRDENDDIFHCYRTHPSSDIFIYSTSKLQHDEVREYRLVSLPITSLKVQAKYSIEVEQYALTKDAYEYWQLLKKTTENLGSLFDPQPSQVTGNMHCITDPGELTIGFFSIGSIKKERIFIHNTQIVYPVGVRPFDPFFAGCQYDTLLLADLPEYEGSDLFIGPVTQGIALIGYSKSISNCVDCRAAGGTNVKPDFWP
jgi:hypothetical protein